jgi:ribosome assembly protein RRB1
VLKLDELGQGRHGKKQAAKKDSDDEDDDDSDSSDGESMDESDDEDSKEPPAKMHHRCAALSFGSSKVSADVRGVAHGARA